MNLVVQARATVIVLFRVQGFFTRVITSDARMTAAQNLLHSTISWWHGEMFESVLRRLSICASKVVIETSSTNVAFINPLHSL